MQGRRHSSYLEAVLAQVSLAWAAACVEALAEGHASDACVLQVLLVLAVSGQQLPEQHLELVAAASALIGPLLSHAWHRGPAELGLLPA